MVISLELKVNHDTRAFCRALYDSYEQDQFLETLSTHIRECDEEIEHLCGRNYLQFIESGRVLSKLRLEKENVKV